MVARTTLSVTLLVHCLSCYNRDGVCLLRGTKWILVCISAQSQSSIHDKDAPTLTSENPQEDRSSLIFTNRQILIHAPQKVSMARQGIWQAVSRSFDLTDWLIVQRLERVLCGTKQQQFTDLHCRYRRQTNITIWNTPFVIWQTMY